MPRSRTANDVDPSDWICLECGAACFQNKSICFRCPVERYANSIKEKSGSFFVGLDICDTLIIRGLPIDSKVTKDEIINLLSKDDIKVKEVFFESRGNYCFIQYENEDKAKEMLDIIRKNDLSLKSHILKINYSVIPMNNIMEFDYVSKVRFVITNRTLERSGKNHSFYMSNSNSQTYGNVLTSHENEPGHNLSIGSAIRTPFGNHYICHRPNFSTFEGPCENGYYKDPRTGFFYNSSSALYYDPVEFVWKFWTSKYQTYIVYEGGDEDLKRSLLHETRMEPDFDPSKLSTGKQFLAYCPNVGGEISKNYENATSFRDSELGKSEVDSAVIASCSPSISQRGNSFSSDSDIQEMDISRPLSNRRNQNCNSGALFVSDSYHLSNSSSSALSSSIDIYSDDDLSMPTTVSDLNAQIEENVEDGKYDYLLPDFYDYLRKSLEVKTYNDIKTNRFYQDTFVINWKTFDCYICGKRLPNKSHLIGHILDDKEHSDNVMNIGND